LVLCFCIIFGLEFNIIRYLWFSGLRLFFYYLRSVFRWIIICVGLQLRFYFYLFRLEYQYFFSVLSKLFYTGLLSMVNILRIEWILCLRYIFIIFNIINYLLIRGIYFFALSVLREYRFSLILCLLYFFILHEFSFFSLIIRFPLSIVFYIKFSCMSLRFLLLRCLFLFPVIIRVQLRSLPILEEIVVSVRLLLIFI